MNEPAKTLQKELFQQIKNMLPENLNYIYALSEILNVAENSVYKRVRGEQAISFEELMLLKNKFPSIQLPNASNPKTKKLLFEYSNVGHKKYTILHQLQDVLKTLSLAQTDENAVVYYAAKDLPLFYYYLFPELAAFRFYSLKRNILFSNDYVKRKFSLKEDLQQSEVKIAEKIWEIFNSISSLEVWCDETLSSTLNQLTYAKATKQFANEKDFQLLINRLNELLDFVEHQAEQGFKGKNENSTFEIYNHEMQFMQNVSLFKSHETLSTFVMHNTTNIIMIADKEFGNESINYLDKIIKHSSPLSKNNAKYRSIYFNSLREKIEKAAK